ncbi:Tryptophan synthase subunit beta like protein [Klebsiella pneumoniae]|nr:hypothetical protein AI3011V1_1341 [Klebsiella pneumoniae]CAH5627197.1 hypothetical protein AI3011V1_1341 [Klebsiella pneumoniae]SMD65550.1 Uncharacterised protein [Klebsiella pneumoniae]SXZ35662.1 Tryptophan synthase subunit beta like protein [Klebsiella pneumoniae]
MKQITLSDMQQQSEAAASAPRLRAHRNFHPELSDPIQRLAIAMEPGTYIRPHRHRHTFELLLPLKGRFVVLNFDDPAWSPTGWCWVKPVRRWKWRLAPGIRCSRSTQAAWYLKSNKALINRLPKWTLWPGRLLKASQALPK